MVIQVPKHLEAAVAKRQARGVSRNTAVAHERLLDEGFSHAELQAWRDEYKEKHGGDWKTNEPAYFLYAVQLLNALDECKQQ